MAATAAAHGSSQRRTLLIKSSSSSSDDDYEEDTVRYNRMFALQHRQRGTCERAGARLRCVDKEFDTG
jgi:hypothetical protein